MVGLQIKSEERRICQGFKTSQIQLILLFSLFSDVFLGQLDPGIVEERHSVKLFHNIRYSVSVIPHFEFKVQFPHAAKLDHTFVELQISLKMQCSWLLMSFLFSFSIVRKIIFACGLMKFKIGCENHFIA